MTTYPTASNAQLEEDAIETFSADATTVLSPKLYNKSLGSVFGDVLTITKQDLPTGVGTLRMLSGDDRLTITGTDYSYGSFYLDSGDDYFEAINTADTGGFWVYGGAGGDEIIGGLGGDQLQGGSGSDVLFGGGGDDVLKGDCYDGYALFCVSGWQEEAGAADTIDGGVGNDVIVGGVGGADGAWGEGWGGDVGDA